MSSPYWKRGGNGAPSSASGSSAPSPPQSQPAPSAAASSGGGGGSAGVSIGVTVTVTVILFVVLLLLILFVWMRCSNHLHDCKRSIEKCHSKCNSYDEQCGAIDRRCQSHKTSCQTQMKNCTKTQHSLLGMWSFDVSSLNPDTPQLPFTVQPTPLLLSVAAPQGIQPTATGQTATSSVIPTPFNGTVQAMTIEMPALLTSGSMTFTVTVNGLPQTLTYTYTSATPSMFSVTKLPVNFSTGDTVGVQFSANNFVSSQTPVTPTVQLWGAFNQ